MGMLEAPGFAPVGVVDYNLGSFPCSNLPQSPSILNVGLAHTGPLVDVSLATSMNPQGQLKEFISSQLPLCQAVTFSMPWV